MAGKRNRLRNGQQSGTEAAIGLYMFRLVQALNTGRSMSENEDMKRKLYEHEVLPVLAAISQSFRNELQIEGDSTAVKALK